MDIYILDYHSVHCYLYVSMYLFKIFPVLVIEDASRWCYFGISYLCFCCLFVLALLYFLAPQNAPCSLCIFLTYVMLLLLLSRFSHVQLCVTPWTAAYQFPPSIGFSGQEYWSGVPLPSPGHLPHPRIEPESPTLQADSLSLSHQAV